MSAIRKSLSHKAQKVPRARLTLSRILLTVAAAFFAFTAAAGTASASATGAHPGFAAQARGYGLSGAQVSTLQHEVSRFIAQHGGKQVAINKVSFPGGSIVFPVPGQKYARPVTSAATARPAAAVETCYTKDFCIYQYPNFGGGIERFFYCPKQKAYKGYNGSYKNNETPGTVAEIYAYNTRAHKPFQTPSCRAVCSDPEWPSYDDILDVKPC
jgi:hypothetical protein